MTRLCATCQLAAGGRRRVGGHGGRRSLSPPLATGPRATAATGAWRVGGCRSTRRPLPRGARQAVRRRRWPDRRCSLRPCTRRARCEGGRGQRGGGSPPTATARVGEPPPCEAGGAVANDGGGITTGGGVLQSLAERMLLAGGAVRHLHGICCAAVHLVLFSVRRLSCATFWGGTLRGDSLRFAPLVRGVRRTVCVMHASAVTGQPRHMDIPLPTPPQPHHLLTPPSPTP